VLKAVERKIEQYINDLEDKDISNIVSKMPAGKRLRAKLMLEIAGSNTLSVIKSAAIVEMIHSASLLHDDVIDDALTRRGVESINAIYGSKSAIMVGDVLYSKAFYELIDIDRKVAKVISNAVVELSLGERKDVYMSESFNIDADAYRHMIYQKTAALIEAASVSAALLSGKNPEIYRIYGKNLGIAFQMIDDILDITSDSKTLGKPALNDFVEGKTTLPYIYLYEVLDEEDRKTLKSYHKRKLSCNEHKWIINKFKEHNIIEKAKKEAFDLVQEAIALMKQAGESGLEAIAVKMVDRSF